MPVQHAQWSNTIVGWLSGWWPWAWLSQVVYESVAWQEFQSLKGELTAQSAGRNAVNFFCLVSVHQVNGHHLLLHRKQRDSTLCRLLTANILSCVLGANTPHKVHQERCTSRVISTRSACMPLVQAATWSQSHHPTPPYRELLRHIHTWPLGAYTWPLWYIIDPLWTISDPLWYICDPLWNISDPLWHIPDPKGYIPDPKVYIPDP